jgi:transposase
VCLEEGTLAGWLYEVLEPHVEELVVTGVRRSRGPKSDKVDAFALAEQLRIGSLETRVYKGRGKFGRLGHVARAYGFVVRDVVRVKNRLKSVLRSRGVGYGAGSSVYAKRDRERWLGELPEATRPLAELLYAEHDGLAALKAKAEKALLAEARKHREWVRCFVADEPGIAMAQARSDRRALPWSNASSNYALAVA